MFTDNFNRWPLVLLYERNFENISSTGVDQSFDFFYLALNVLNIRAARILFAIAVKNLSLPLAEHILNLLAHYDAITELKRHFCVLFAVHHARYANFRNYVFNLGNFRS